MDNKLEEYLTFNVLEIFKNDEIKYKNYLTKFTLEELNSVKNDDICKKFAKCEIKSLLFDWLGALTIDNYSLIDFSVDQRLKLVNSLLKKINKNRLKKFVQDYIIVDQLMVKYGDRE
jgi:hypothetical protein